MLTVRMYLHNLQTKFLQWHYRRTVGRGIAKQLKMTEVAFSMEIKMSRILVTKQTKKRKPKPTNQTNPPTKNTTSIYFKSNHSLIITHKDHGSFFSLTMHFHCCFLHAKSIHIYIKIYM